MRFIAAAMLLVACGEKEDTAVESETEDAVVAEEEPQATPDIESDPCDPEEGAVGMRFEGSVKYPDGSYGNQSNTRVHMCSGSCTLARWGEGGFCYPEGSLEPGVYSLKIVPYGFEGHATPLSVITVDADDIVLEQDVMVPEYSNVLELTETELFDAGNGLEINVDPAGYASYYGTDNYVAAVPVDPATSGLPLVGIDSEKIVGMWYLGSFDATVAPKWSFQMATELPEGTTVQILNAAYHDRKWMDVGTATVDAEGILRSDINSGIARLTTVILLAE